MENEISWSNSEIGKAFSSDDFVLKTQQQIAKDFAQHGFTFEVDFELRSFEISRLKQAVLTTLAEIIEKAPSKWLPLMYSLDISENKYVQFFSNASSDWLNDFVEIVIRREAQKVFFREKLK